MSRDGMDGAVEHAAPGDPIRDGIEEEDHPIPRWFNWSFAATIIFAGFYIPYYVLSDWSSTGQWQADVKAAGSAVAAVREALPSKNPFRNDPQAIAEGQEVFTTVCAACHLPDGRGLIGPSLIDPYWKYGHDDPDLYESVALGRPAGMPPWATQLGSDKIWKSLAFMETLATTDEPGVGSPDYVPPAP